MSIIFHVDMDSFFASVEQQANPKLRGKPIAVSGDPKSRTVVAAASKEAKRFGVKSAMTIGEARRLCPQITFVLGDPDKYVEVSRRVIRIFSEFTPDVEVASIDEAFLDVTGWCERYVCTQCTSDVGAGRRPRPSSVSCGAIHFARAIKQRIHDDVGAWITCSIGIAPNKRLAKLASDFRKPDGIVIVHDGAPPAQFHSCHPEGARATEGSRTITDGILSSSAQCFGRTRRVARNDMESRIVHVICRSDLLASLRIRDLCGIGPRIEERLRAIGIATVTELAAAPIHLLTATFGKCGYDLHDMALGEDDSVVDANDRAPKSMGHATTLPRDAHTLTEIRPVVEELSEKIAARLRREEYRGSVVHVTLRFRDFTSRSEQRTIAITTNDGLQISREAMRLIERWHITQPIRLVGVSVAGLTAADVLQRSLFPNDERWSAAVRAMDAVNDRYGEWVVQRASLLRGERFLRKVAAAFRSTAHLRE